MYSDKLVVRPPMPFPRFFLTNLRLGILFGGKEFTVPSKA